MLLIGMLNLAAHCCPDKTPHKTQAPDYFQVGLFKGVIMHTDFFKDQRSALNQKVRPQQKMSAKQMLQDKAGTKRLHISASSLRLVTLMFN